MFDTFDSLKSKQFQVRVQVLNDMALVVQKRGADLKKEAFVVFSALFCFTGVERVGDLGR